MNTVRVNAGHRYDVLIGRNLLRELACYAAAVTQTGKFAVVTDSNVSPLYLATALSSLPDDTCVFTVPAGETSKNGQNYLKILNFLAENRLTRGDCLIALGGGVVGDLTGFAAATYLRGIAYIQVPTTLLAAVDSSVGGKTAIDLPAGKNLAGAFYQPSLVVCDIDCLNTLPQTVFRDGCAEVIKYSVLYDKALFDTLMQSGIDFDRERVITRCVELKRDVVACDEFDRGARQLLNFGHTVGHGVEACSGFSVSHGCAVAIGMAIVSRAAEKYGLCDKETADAVGAILRRFALPSETDFTPQMLARSALSDKKRMGETVNLIVPERIGKCTILPTPIDKLEAFIEAGM